MTCARKNYKNITNIRAKNFKKLKGKMSITEDKFNFRLIVS